VALDDARRKVEESAAVARANPKRSRQLLREALAAVPDYEPALQALSLKVFHDENHDEARDLAAHCLKVNPDNETCTTVRNYALQRGPEIDAMAEQTEACLAATPKDPKCLATMVAYDVLTGKIDQATRLSDTLESVDPDGKPTLLAKARVASVAGRYEDARHDFDEACRLGMEQACFRAEALRAEGW
jgi:tetratricopeptide (TPR) repeat protein